MPQNESILLFPLRSNSNGLLTGRPVELVRRRLKFASLSFERILLEAGVYTLQAGPGGSSAWLERPPHRDEPRWQTPAGRHVAQASSFSLSVGREITPGVAAPVMHTALASEATASWSATLYPFVKELPAGTDWMEFTDTRDPSGDMRRLTDRWKRADEHNRSLERAVPERFVRGAVIGDANRDLGFAAEYGVAVSMDSLHTQVVSQRFYDDGGWAMRGFAVPVLFPEVGGLPWEAIADLRRDRNMARFRAILQEVEAETADEMAGGGDLEAAAQRAYRRKLADAQEAVESLGVVVHKTLRGFVIGSVIGAFTAGIVGPIAIPAGAAAGAVPSVVTDVRDVLRQRKSRGWVALQQRIEQVR